MVILYVVNKQQVVVIMFFIQIHEEKKRHLEIRMEEKRSLHYPDGKEKRVYVPTIAIINFENEND